ncbi:BZ3500_MvSof-1268-A1-R1_Chr2-2g04952 [Microbotryum saponariae]|uniref:BZ3500_MvSof-1268-A1-R1_Chr2-2g04952 protein n=1 Tax=Microbotryum saponariae TaxID=289078 RepID=A0A2X0LN84_9BASI|nr:BZ3500_MvSof-1268-A1-R1_Chr2-2g04952 [Microbotryum saponariae]SDA00553.1 BZ3501_MvSof-1269-A2-R1_Chr2-2g04626 [Microbotryum saponariae]
MSDNVQAVASATGSSNSGEPGAHSAKAYHQDGETHVLPLTKSFSRLALIGLAYAILNSWTAMAASISVALPSGGPSVVLWGIPISFLGSFATAVSLAEICHVYPSSGGQYHWVALLSPPGRAPLFAFIEGWIACAGWVALVATASSLAGQLVTGMVALAHQDVVVQRYQIFIVYVAYALLAFASNLWGHKILPIINQAALSWSLAGAATIAIVCLACKSGHYTSGKFVFATFINETGWNNGVSWILGLLQACFGLTGFDGVTHMVEEIPRPHINAPIAMCAAVLIGAVSSFIFLVCLLFTTSNVNQAIESSAGVLLAAIYQATGSVAGSLCLQVFPVVSMFFAAQGLLTSSSRMCYAFARDGGLPFSKFFGRANKEGIPVNTLILNTVLVIIFGLVYLGSSSALNAILSSSVVFLNISYSAPIILLVVRGRHLLRPEGFPEPTLTLGRFWGPVANITALIFILFTTVFFLFPPELPVTGSNMNYAIVVFAVVLIIATAHYFISARRTYTGPKDLNVVFELVRARMEGRDGSEVTEVVGSDKFDDKTAAKL